MRGAVDEMAQNLALRLGEVEETDSIFVQVSPRRSKAAKVQKEDAAD